MIFEKWCGRLLRKTSWLAVRLPFGLLLLSLSSFLDAGSPVWTFTPLTATTISVSTADTATVQYQVTNQSRRSHTLEMQAIPGISQNTTPGNCANPFILGFQQSCTLTLTVDGATLQRSVVSGPVVCQQGNALQCYQPSIADLLNITLTAAPGATTLSASVSTIGLSVRDITLNAALTGTPRRITITNTGVSSATNVTYLLSPALPSGTTITPASCGTIAASGTCVLTITPGSTPSAAPNDTSPTPITLSISGTNTNTLTPTMNVLTYGSVYQGGYIYAVDDTTPDTGSIGGKVAALTDQSAGVIWSSNGSSVVSDVAILGIDERSTSSVPSPTSPAYPTGTPAYLACDGNSDGACNSVNIVSYYNFNRASGGAAPTPLDQYAAGLCQATISGESDWYLPAICEAGYDDIGVGANGCGTQASPTLQNMLSNLFDAGWGNLAGEYWSSTEDSSNTAASAWLQTFDSMNIGQFAYDKSYTLKVRCSRALTP